nr:hypothetical protein [Ferrimicrobium acidiphilum]
MKIVSVKFGQLRSYGEFQNMTIEAEALVEGIEDPEYVLRDLRQWVADQLAEAIERPRIAPLQAELKGLQEQVSAEEARKWRLAHQAHELELKIKGIEQQRLDEPVEEE